MSLLAAWGCEDIPLLDPARVCEYARRHGIDMDRVCCPDVPSSLLVDTFAGPYLSPAEDHAAAVLVGAADPIWWWDDTRPEAQRFFGLIPVSVTGFDSGGLRRDASVSLAGCGTAVTYGPLFDDGLTLVIEAQMVGMSCCDVAYGYRKMKQLLAGCCAQSCTSTSMRFATCVSDVDVSCLLPGTAPVSTGAVSPWRTVTNLNVISGPTIMSGSPYETKACGACGCDDITIVRFTVRADPGLMFDRTLLVAPVALAQDGECQIVCGTSCPPVQVTLQDPTCPSTIPARTPSVRRCGCPVVIGQRACFGITVAGGFPVDLEPIIRTGSGEIRDISVKFWRKQPGIPAGDPYYSDCNTCQGFVVTYLPEGSVWRRNPCTGAVTATVPIGRVLRAENTLYGLGGNYDGCLRLGCGEWVGCVDYPAGLAADATFELWGRTVEP